MYGEERYAKELKIMILNNPNIKWIKQLLKGLEELAAAYYHCSLFALPSKNETQPISALEAAAMNKPLMLMDKKYAYQTYYKGAILCKSTSVKDIEIALEQCLILKNYSEKNLELSNCREEKAGNMYKNCYLNLIKL